MTAETLGARLRRLRGDLSLRALAHRSGVHFTTLHRIENGQRARESTLRQLAPALGTDLATLTGHPSGGAS